MNKFVMAMVFVLVSFSPVYAADGTETANAKMGVKNDVNNIVQPVTVLTVADIGMSEKQFAILQVKGYLADARVWLDKAAKSEDSTTVYVGFILDDIKKANVVMKNSGLSKKDIEESKK